MSQLDASTVQNRLSVERDNWFSKPVEQWGRIRTYNRSAYDLARLVEEMTFKKVDLEVIEVKRLPNPERYMTDMVTYGFPIVGGNSRHAALLTDYDAFFDTFTIIDPLFPTTQVIKQAGIIAQDVKEEGWITLVKKLRAL